MGSLEIWHRVVRQIEESGKLRRFRLDPILFLELAIVVTLTLALTAPHLDMSGSRLPRLAVILDASLSMEASLEDGRTPRELALERLEEVYEEGTPWARVELISSPSGRTRVLEGNHSWSDVEAWFDLAKTRPGRFEPDRHLSRWLSSRPEIIPDRVLVLSDQPSSVDGGERLCWQPLTRERGANSGWIRFGSDMTVAGKRRYLLVARSTGSVERLPLSAIFQGSGKSMSRVLTTDDKGEASLVVPHEELDQLAGDKIEVSLRAGDGNPLDDALSLDDSVTLVRNPLIPVGFHGRGLESIQQAVKAWAGLGITSVSPEHPLPRIAFISEPGEPAGWKGIPAVLFPGADSRGIHYGNPSTGGWIERFLEDPILDGLPLYTVELAEATQADLPEGTSPLAWAGETPVLWRTPVGDLVLAFRPAPPYLARGAPPAALVLLFYRILESLAPWPGGFAPDRAIIDSEVDVSLRARPGFPPRVPKREGERKIALTGYLAGLGGLLIFFHGWIRKRRER